MRGEQSVMIHAFISTQLNFTDMETEIILSLIIVVALAAVGYLGWRNYILRAALNRAAAAGAEHTAARARLQERETAHATKIDELQQQLKSEREANRELQQIKGKFDAVQHMEKKLAEQFRAMTDENIKRANAELEDRSRKTLDGTIAPFREEIKTMRDRMEELNKSSSNERVELRAMIGDALQTTAELTRAFTQKSQTRGSMGEMLLQTSLEKLGWKEGEHFHMQVALKTETGANQYADCVIHLPQKRKIVLDAKFLLNHWQAHTTAESQGDAARAAESLTKHIRAMRAQVDEMQTRDYPSRMQDALDFTLLFIPLDLAVYRAFEEDANLFQYAWDKRIGIISPSTLIPTVRVIDNLWTLEKQRGAHQEIINHARKMYDKFVGVAEGYETLGKHMATAQKTYAATERKLHGHGGLAGQFKKLEEFGVRGQKRLPSNADDI